MSKTNTPWGVATSVSFYDPEKTIQHVATAEHGGFGVSVAREMPAHLAALGASDETTRWFEQDHAWAAVATAFPQYFCTGRVEEAKELLKRFFPGAYTRQFDERLTAADSERLEQAAWEDRTVNRFVVTGSFSSGWNIPQGHVYAAGWRRFDEATAGFLVPQDLLVNPDRLILDDFQRWEPDRSLAGPVSSDAGGGPTVYLRTIAQALEKRLLENPESPLHWVAVVDENSLGAPNRLWEYDDCIVQLGMTEGNSEGMLLYVHAQPNRYKPAALTPLFRIKVLCGARNASSEFLRVWEFFHSEAFTELVNPPSKVARA